MRVLITSGLNNQDVGGPAHYADNLKREFEILGHKTSIASYSGIERAIPIGARHLYFLLKIIPSILMVDRVITLDTFSVGVPTVLVSALFRKKCIVRVGGDFLWEAYINRTGQKITLPQFYTFMPSDLSIKERIILLLTKFIVRKADVLMFNTEWQKNIWGNYYHISEERVRIVRNFVPPKADSVSPKDKSFLWAGRNSKVKNLDQLKLFAEKVGVNITILLNTPHTEVLKSLASCYAVVHPSLSDVCPNFILEAVSFDKPFIMTKETGLNELYPKGGVFIDPLNGDELEHAIDSMLDDNKYNQYVEELKSINITHGWREMAQEILNI